MEKLGHQTVRHYFFKLVTIKKKKPTAEVTLSSGYNARIWQNDCTPAEAVTRLTESRCSQAVKMMAPLLKWLHVSLSHTAVISQS